jgi:hypothetical protein
VDGHRLGRPEHAAHGRERAAPLKTKGGEPMNHDAMIELLQSAARERLRAALAEVEAALMVADDSVALETELADERS